MDTSKYIKMCDCEEIQRDHTFKIGDFVHNLDHGFDEWTGYVGDNECFPYNDSIWLPHQDQLQKLSGLSWREFDRSCQVYNETTKEQAGIIVVMKKKFNKTWDGKKWI